MRSISKFLCTAVLCAFSIGTSWATVTDATGDFLTAYAGPRNADLDVVSADVLFDGSNFRFTASLAGAIGTTAGGFYVWGVDRGAGATTSNFGALGFPDVIFDSVVIIRPNGTGQVSLLGAGGSTTLLGSSAISITGNTFSVLLPSALLPSRGFTFDNYLHNLWPRGPVGATTQIADFAPDTSMARVRVPEPSALPLLSLALGLVGFTLRRRMGRA
jgi:hypothetical protein